jgi:hypothetical protein
MGDMSVQSREPPRGVTVEDVWATLQETGQLIRELTAKTDLELKKTARQIKETDRQIKETDRQMKKTDRKIGELGNRLGEVIEHIMSPDLHEKFKGMGFSFSRSSRNVEIRGPNGQGLAEIDVLLENGDCVLAVEVKTRLTTGDVKYHVKRMGILRGVADGHNDRRKYLGAVAGAAVNQDVLAYALKSGFYVIVPSGETVDIKAPEGFRPRIWEYAP